MSKPQRVKPHAHRPALGNSAALQRLLSLTFMASAACGALVACGPASDSDEEVDDQSAAAQYAERHIKFNRSDGKYTVANIDADFGNHERINAGSAEEGRLRITGGTLRFRLPKGKILSESGTNLAFRVPRKREYTFEYKMKFEKGYDWTRQTKMPGPCGYQCSKPGIGCKDGSCWAARFVAHEKSKGSSEANLRTYVYHKDMGGKYGEHIGGNLYSLKSGQWYTLKMHIKLNSGSSKNGILRAWVNGKQVLNKTDMRWVTQDKARDVGRFRLSTFHGGRDDASRPDHTQYSWVDDVRWVDGGTLGSGGGSGGSGGGGGSGGEAAPVTAQPLARR